MAALTLYSTPVAVLMNGRLCSQERGVITGVDASEAEIRFKAIIDHNPSSVRYGITLQMSALRDMGKEHNPDQIPDYQADIFFPTQGIFEYETNIPVNLPGNSDMPRAFRINHTIEFGSALILSFTCRGVSSDRANLPRLRHPQLESSLKRIFGIVDTAASLTNACLEIDCLVKLIEEGNRGTIFAIDSMRDAIVQEMNQSRGLQQRLAGLSTSKKLPNPAKQNQKSKNKSTPSTYEGYATQKRVPPTIIEGKSASPDKNFKEQSFTTTAHVSSGFSKTSPMKYLHPHAFDTNR